MLPLLQPLILRIYSYDKNCYIKVQYQGIKIYFFYIYFKNYIFIPIKNYIDVKLNFIKI
jgi:hypothetical protein